MWSTPLRLEDYYAAPPITGSGNLPPREPGVYVASLDPISPQQGPTSGDRVLYVGTTYRGSQPDLLFRVSSLVFDALGYTGDGSEPGSKHAYFHSGGRKIWLHCQRCGHDPRMVFLSWQTAQDCCPAHEERCLYQLLKGQPQFLNVQGPWRCLDGNHKH